MRKYGSATSTTLTAVYVIHFLRAFIIKKNKKKERKGMFTRGLIIEKKRWKNRGKFNIIEKLIILNKITSLIF